ncbi:site-specific integrase [Desulfoscipio gibsoniae]
MKQTIREVTRGALEALAARGHSKYTIDTYRYFWNGLIRYFDDKEYVHFDLTVADEYIRLRSESLKKTERYIRFIKRAILILDSFNRDGTISNRYCTRLCLIEHKEYIQLLEQYGEAMKTYEYSMCTIEHYLSHGMKFLQHLEIEELYDISRLEAKHIFSYISTLEDYSAVSIKNMTGALCLFLKYLYQNGYVTHDLSNQAGSVRRCLSRKLPSYWTKDEVIVLLNFIDKGNPNEKRDYAMILLVARLGLRSGDLKKLKFENLKWSSNTIELVQSKTGVPISLPLLRDVGWAIIDYVENARPKIDSSYVFLSHNAPYLPLSERNHLYRTLEKYMQRTHIPVVGKRRSGMHSLRHSLATTLIEQDTSLHLISDILGHTSSNSTSIYLQTDIARLRDCALSLREDGE